MLFWVGGTDLQSCGCSEFFGDEIGFVVQAEAGAGAAPPSEMLQNGERHGHSCFPLYLGLGVFWGLMFLYL